METLKDILWPVVLLGGLGALIDFLIGRTGQEKARDWLFKWWVIFDDVRWQNFGREEGLFAGRFIEKWFGKGIWSTQRIKAFLILAIGSLTLSCLIAVCVSRFAYHTSCLYCTLPIYGGVMAILLHFAVFTTSISFTKFITFRMAYLCGNSSVRNLIVFIMMLMINFYLLNTWRPVADGFRAGFLWLAITGTIDNNLEENADKSIDFIALTIAEYVPSVLRFVLSIVFVGSFLLRPVVIRPIFLFGRGSSRVISRSSQ